MLRSLSNSCRQLLRHTHLTLYTCPYVIIERHSKWQHWYSKLLYIAVARQHYQETDQRRQLQFLHIMHSSNMCNVTAVQWQATPNIANTCMLHVMTIVRHVYICACVV
jgi:hypothetical protein